MKFIKLKKRKFYETWVGKKCKCKVYIFRCKDDLFHFTSISCKGEIYSSLYDNLIYNDFELCCKDAAYKTKSYCKRCHD